MKRRNWADVDAKRRASKRCLVCGRSDRRLEAAHLIDRGRDRRLGDVIVVDPDEVVFLCGPFPAGCHGAYDFHRLDLFPYLTEEELVGACRAAGGPGAALQRLSGPLSRSRRPAHVQAFTDRFSRLEALYEQKGT
jgi:hypothetical protein